MVQLTLNLPDNAAVSVVESPGSAPMAIRSNAVIARDFTDTRMAAYREITKNLKELHAVIFAAIARAGADGLTPDECAAICELDRLTVRPRFTELCIAGMIYDSKQRRQNTSGRKARVMVAVLPENLPADRSGRVWKDAE